MRIFTDGACKGNPGRGGWGYVIEHNGKEVQSDCGGESPSTNNRMEMIAVIEALKVAKYGDQILSDSSYVIKGINEWIHGWKKYGWRTQGGEQVKNAELWQEMDRLREGKNILFSWVRGHDGNRWNERADELANEGVLKAKRHAPNIPRY